MRPVKFYIKKGFLIKDENGKRLISGYLDKAKNNLITLKILSKIQDDKALRKKYDIPKDYSTYEWIAITGYYKYLNKEFADIKLAPLAKWPI